MIFKDCIKIILVFVNPTEKLIKLNQNFCKISKKGTINNLFIFAFVKPAEIPFTLSICLSATKWVPLISMML